MSDREPPFDINAALTASTELITHARADLISTIETYEATGPNLAKSALERIERLNCSVSPARTYVAAGLIEELRAFDNFWVPLGWNAGALLLTLVNNLTTLAMKMMMSPQFPNPADLEGLDAISTAQAYADASRRGVERNQIMMLSAVVAEADVAKAVLEVSGLLAARLDALDSFIHSTDQASTVPAEARKSFRVLPGVVIREGLFLAAEETLKATIKELPRNVPVVGIAASVVAIGLEVRGKQKELQERREHLEQMAKAYVGPGLTDDMSIQLTYFQQDNKNVAELLSLISKLADKLR